MRMCSVWSPGGNASGQCARGSCRAAVRFVRLGGTSLHTCERAMPRSVQADRDTSTSGFQLLHISLLREYFDFEYQ